MGCGSWFPPSTLFLLLLLCRPSPAGHFSHAGASTGGTAWVQFLQQLTSAQRLSKCNPLSLMQQSRTRVPLPVGLLSCCCQPQHFALKSYADAGLRWLTDKCSVVGREVQVSDLCLQLCLWDGALLSPFLHMFCWFGFFFVVGFVVCLFFAYFLLQFRYKILIHISALNNCPLPRWPDSLWSNQSNLQEIWDSLLLSQLRVVSTLEWLSDI